MKKINLDDVLLGICFVALVVLVIYHRVAFIELFVEVFTGTL